MNLVWHYTVGVKLSFIRLTGALLPASSEHDSLRERPVLWFSRRQNWEPTATKLIGSDKGAVYRPSVAELHQMMGLYRFGLHAQDPRLVPWGRLPKLAGISFSDAKRMAKNAEQLGAAPFDWLGSLVEVPVEDCAFQRWNGAAWEGCDFAAADATVPAAAALLKQTSADHFHQTHQAR